LWVDIGATLDQKIEALFCHASQLTETGAWFREFLRETAEAAGRTAGVTYAEGFRRIVLA
jgi:LmbE family N-acetylglucosaminyl deacetylase